MKEKLILATVNSKKDLYTTTADEFSAISPNVQMGLLASYIRSKKIDVEIIDSEADAFSIEGLINAVEKKEPMLLGIISSGTNPSSSTMTMVGIINFFQKFNKTGSKTKTFVWGPHPTVLPERTLRETGASYVIRGEGYETIVELFDALLKKDDNLDAIKGLSYLIERNGETRYVENRPTQLVKDLDSLPNVDWDIMNPKKYKAHNWHCLGDIKRRSPYAVVWTSFGCPYQCTFCCINNLFGKRTQRFRSIDRVIDEISLLVEKYNVRHIRVLDELFVVNPRRIEEFCDKLERKNYDLNMWSYARIDTVNKDLLKRLKKVGMNWISYGFETTASKILKEIKKGLKGGYDEVIKMTQDAGIHICADVMFGMLDDDYDTMRQTYDFLVSYNFEWVNMYPLFAYPGTELYNTQKEPSSWEVYALYGYECTPRGTKYLSSKDVLKFRDEAFTKYYSRPEYLHMIEDRFGSDTKEHIQRMVATPLRRRLLE